MTDRYYPFLILFMRAFGAGVSLLFVFLLSSKYADLASSFFFTQSLCILASFFSVFGLNGYSLQRAVKVNRYEKSYLLMISIETLIRSILIVIPVLIIISIFFSLDVNYYLFPLVVSYSLSSNLYNYAIGKQKQVLSIFCFTLFPNVILLILVFLGLGLDVVALIYSISYIWSFYYIFNNIPGSIKIKKLGKNDLKLKFYDYRGRVDFFIQEILGQIFTSISVVIAGLVLVSGQLNEFIIYNKVFSVCALVIGSINISTAPQVAKIFIAPDKKSGNRLINKYGLLNFSLVFIIIIVFVAFISFWGEKVPSVELNYPFLLFSVSYLIVASCSCSHYVLNMLGKQKEVREFSITSALFGLVFMTALGYLFGVVGVVVGLCISLVLQATLCRSKLFFYKA